MPTPSTPHSSIPNDLQALLAAQEPYAPLDARTKQFVEIFWNTVIFPDAEHARDPKAHWIWRGRHNKAGYGIVPIPGQPHKYIGAHVLAYNMYHPGAHIPEGLDCSHLCRVWGGPYDCVRPAHLTAETHKENMARIERGLSNRRKAAGLRR